MLKENRSLERGLIILETLAKSSAMSLADIHRDTGLPKSTLRRLLATLESRRFVRRSISDRKYRVTVNLPDITIEPVPPGLALMADIGLTHALDLTKKIGWPSDIHVLEDSWTRVVESTRTSSQFSMYNVKIDLRVNLFGSAAGTACLAEMDEETVRELYDRPSLPDLLSPRRFALTWAQLQAQLDKVRSQGYGTRITNFRGEIVPNDRLSVIALPIHKHGELMGALSVLWPKAYMSDAEFASLHLSDTLSAVEAIEIDLERPARSPMRNPAATTAIPSKP